MSVNIEDKIFINVMLEDGRDSAGVMHYRPLPLPDINPEKFDAQKVISIVQKLAPCLLKTYAGFIHKIQGKSLTVLS